MNDEITPPDHKNNEEKVTKVRNLADLQRMKLEKLMKNPVSCFIRIFFTSTFSIKSLLICRTNQL